MLCIDVDDDVPVTEDPGRPGEMKRTVEEVTEGGRKGVRVREVYNYGRVRYGGHAECLHQEYEGSGYVGDLTSCTVALCEDELLGRTLMFRYENGP